MLLRLLVIVFLAGLVPTTDAKAADPASAVFRQAQALAAQHLTPDGFQLDTSAAAVPALRRQWAAAQHLIIAMLDRQPDIAPAALEHRAKQAGLSLDAIRLDRDAMLVGARSGEFGTVFLLRRGAGGRFGAALDLNLYAADRSRGMPALAAWQAVNAAPACRAANPGPALVGCGPIAPASLLRLPDQTDGVRRFAILGDHVKAAGGTEQYQISIWRWDGRTATPLFARTLFQAITLPILVGQDARGFTLHAKDNYETLNDCDECGGRQTVWRFDLPRIGAGLPRIYGASPELDLVDRLYTRLYAHRPATDLAASSVIARLRGVELDMLGHWRKLGADRRGQRLCVDAVGFERPQIFRIVRRAGKLWVADVTFARPRACDGARSQG